MGRTLHDEVDSAFDMIQTQVTNLRDVRGILPTAPPPAPPAPPPPPAPVVEAPPPPQTTFIAVSMNVGDAKDSARVISLHELSPDEAANMDGRYAALIEAPDAPDDETTQTISLDELVPARPQHRSSTRLVRRRRKNSQS